MKKILILIFLHYCMGCFSSIEEQSIDDIEYEATGGFTHYTLRKENTIIHDLPLPSQTSIYIDWHHKSGAKKSILGFIGYDFNADERFDLVAVLNHSGRVEAYVYDFDLDGLVDLIRKAK